MISATTISRYPPTLIASTTGTNSVDLSWTAYNYGSFQSYQVLQSNDIYGNSVIELGPEITSSRQSSYQVTNLNPNTSVFEFFLFLR